MKKQNLFLFLVLELARGNEWWAPKWATSLAMGLEVLQDRETAVRLLPLGNNDNISLLQVADAAGSSNDSPACRLVYVTWIHASTKFGREVIIDSDKRAVYSVTLTEAKSWMGAIIVHPAIGIHMRKVPRVLDGELARPLIPEKIQRLHSMWEKALSPTITLRDPCTFCCSASGEDIFVCALCLLPWHPHCAHTAAMAEDLPDVAQYDCHVPRLFIEGTAGLF